MLRNAVIAVSLLAAPLMAQCEDAQLFPADGLGGDNFGGSVSLRGTRALITSIYDDGIGTDSGSAYIFELQGSAWVQTAKLLASDTAFEDRFGHAGAIFGDTALITTRYNQDAGYGTGSAYIFERVGGTWTETAYLVASSMQSGALFGQSGDLDDGVAAVGASTEDGPGGANQGAVHIYRKLTGTWTETQTLYASDGKGNTLLGQALAIDGNRMVVGARVSGGTPAGAGAAYVFESSGGVWTEKQKLTAGTVQLGALFGEYVAISGNVIAVAAPLEDTLGTDAGAVYIFEHNGTSWVQTGKLLPDSAAATKYGPVDVSQGAVLVGAPSDGGNGANSGAVYRYHKQGGVWKQTGKFTGDDTGAGDSFGTAVSISGNDILVGANLAENGAGLGCGEARIFGELNSLIPYGAGTAGTGGITPKLLLSGCTETGGTLVIGISNAKPGALAIMLLGLNQTSLPLLGCTLLTFPLLPLQIALPLDGSGAISLPALIPPGVVSVTIDLQAFVVDPGGPKGYSSSNASTLTLGG